MPSGKWWERRVLPSLPLAQMASSPLPHCSARARRLTRQLSSRSIPLTRPASQAARSLPLHSAGRTLSRQSEQLVRARVERLHRPRCSAYRPRPHYGARLRLSPKTGNMAASFARPSGCRPRLPIALSTARFAPTSQNTPTSLSKPSWSETSPPGCGQLPPSATLALTQAPVPSGPLETGQFLIVTHWRQAHWP